MMHTLDSGNVVTIPLARADDLERVGAVASHFATLLDRSIEVVSIVDPDDDFSSEFRRIAAAVERFAESTNRTVELHLSASALPLQAVLDACSGRLVCMATAASPFQADHYVGSFAAALLAESTAPVILVGPAATGQPRELDRVVVAVSADVDGNAALVTGAAFAQASGTPLAKVIIDPKGVIYETDYLDANDALPDEVHASMTRGPLNPRQISHELVERSESGLLVLSTRAHRGLSWICEGSVSFDAISQTPAPVVAVGPKAFVDVEADDRPHPVEREVVLQSPDAEGAAAELDERIRFLRKATSTTYTARPTSVR